MSRFLSFSLAREGQRQKNQNVPFFYKTASKEIIGEVVVGARPLKVFDDAITKAQQQN